MNAPQCAHRCRFLVIGVGALASMALSQLTTAPTARADDFTEVFDNVQFAVG